MIKYIGSNPDIPTVGFQEFKVWMENRYYLQFDIETTFTETWAERELVTLQFGNFEGTERWVFEATDLIDEDVVFVKKILEDDSIIKLIHNAAFECTMMLFYGILIRGIYDTMIADKILDTGYEREKGYFSLAGLTSRYFFIEMDKTLQTSFVAGQTLSVGQLHYAADDVMHLGKIYRIQVPLLNQEELYLITALEMDVISAFAEITCNGMLLDQKAWLANIEVAKPLVDAAKVKLDAWLVGDTFRDKAIELGFLSRYDDILFNYNSNIQRKQMLNDLFPYLIDISKGKIRAFFKANFGHPHARIFKPIMEEGDTSYLLEYLHKEKKQYLIDNGWLIPAMTPTINWGSWQQRLPIFQVVEPQLLDTSKEALSETTHPLIQDYIVYGKQTKLLTTYGQAFIDQYVEEDGRVRTNFNQILTTGRVSSSKPNMQNIPKLRSYRNAFVAPPGWKYVGSDYYSQELNVIAYISQDPVWIKALEEGKDLHSVCSELVFGSKWKLAAEDNCAYYAVGADGKLVQEKCKCPKHEELRDAVKSINFGLAYGMSKFKLARSMKSTLDAAEELINTYFTVFPSIKASLTSFGEFGVEHGYIMTLSPFFRRRYFPMWHVCQRHIDDHIAQMHNYRKGRYHSLLGSIERASKNMPIQGASADMVKIALWMMQQYIWDNNLQNKVKLIQQIHDEVQTNAIDEYAEEWSIKMNEIMIDAALIIVDNGLLKAETKINTMWDK